MSASEKTTNYDLPIYKPTDILSVLTDFNECVRKIDIALANVSTTATNADGKTEVNKEQIEELKNTGDSLEIRISELADKLDTFNSGLTLLKTHTNEQDLELQGLKDYNNTQDNKILSLKNETDENIRDLENEDTQLNNKITNVQSEFTSDLNGINEVLTELKNNFDNVITFHDVNAIALNFNLQSGTRINVVIDSISIGDKTKIEIYLDFIVTSTNSNHIEIRLEGSIFNNLFRRSMYGYFYTYGTSGILDTLPETASDLKPVLFNATNQNFANMYMALSGVSTENPVEVKAYLTGTFSNFS